MDISIVATTYFPEGEVGALRGKAFIETVKSWAEYLIHDYPIHLICVNDGFDFLEYYKEAGEVWWNSGKGVFISYTHSRSGVGESLNRGFSAGFQRTPVVAYFVDDWALTQPFDISSWVDILCTQESTGMIRLGPPHPNTRGSIVMFPGHWQGWGLKLDRYSYAYAQRPALYHKRFFDYYGKFKENASAIDCEREYAETFCQNLSGPDIVLALPHPWKHIDTISLSDVTPE